MKRTVSLLLVLAVALLVPMASLAEAVFGPVPISYGKNAYEVDVTDFSFSAEEGVRVFIQAQEGVYLVHFMHEDREAGFEPLEDIVLPIDDGDSPFYSAVQVALEQDGQAILFTSCNAAHDGVEFLYDVSVPPQALLVYPRDGGPDSSVRLELPEELVTVETPTPAPTAEPTEAPTPGPTPEGTGAPLAGDPDRARTGLERTTARERGLPEDSPATPMPDFDWTFTIGGTAYEILELQDEPVYQQENRLDSREGHCILFRYVTSDISEATNKTLFSESRIIAPSGEEIRTFSNSGNVQNPYTLYFGLPRDVLLGDCMLRVPDDAGEKLIPLGEGALAAAAAMTTPKPISASDAETAPNAVAAPAVLSNQESAQPSDAPTDEPTAAPTEEPATAAPTEEPTAAPQAASTGFETIVTSALQALSEEAKDPWQKAIYDAGAVDFALETDGDNQLLTLALRSFDPDLKALGAYPGEDPVAWRAQMLENVSAHSLPVSIKLKEGELDDESAQKALQRAVRAAAETTKTAFNKNAVRECLADAMLPSPIEKLSDLEELHTGDLNSAFVAYVSDIMADTMNYEACALLFYGQVSQKLSVKDGPHALVLNCKGAAPATLLEKARDATLETLSQQYKSNEMSRTDIVIVFYKKLLESANALRKKGAEDFSLLLDIDDILVGDYGVDYQNFLNAYTFEDTQEALVSAVWALPDAPPQEFPKNGYLSGSKSGTKVIIKAPGDGLGRYVQMRTTDTDEVTVTLFIRSGGSATVRVPQGFYYLLIASGESWYGEEGLFGETGGYSKTSETEILSKKYYHTITLQTATDGNISTWGAEMDDFF